MFMQGWQGGTGPNPANGPGRAQHKQHGDGCTRARLAGCGAKHHAEEIGLVWNLTWAL